jgi:hypothetical protein
MNEKNLTMEQEYAILKTKVEIAVKIIANQSCLGSTDKLVLDIFGREDIVKAYEDKENGKSTKELDVVTMTNGVIDNE